MKDEELKILKDYLDKAASFELPSYDRLPAVALYMEQVITYVNSILAPLSTSDKQMLTSFMVNNYVKAKILKEPDRKKYNVDHLGYLLAISLLKNVLSIGDISLLIGMDDDVSTDKTTLYRFFRTMSSDIFRDVAGRTKNRVDRFSETYEKTKIEDEEKANKQLDDSIGLIALRMSIQAAVYQLVSQALFRYLEESRGASPVNDKADLRAETKKEKKEAKRLASINDKKAKKGKNKK